MMAVGKFRITRNVLIKLYGRLIWKQNLEAKIYSVKWVAADREKVVCRRHILPISYNLYHLIYMSILDVCIYSEYIHKGMKEKKLLIRHINKYNF